MIEVERAKKHLAVSEEIELNFQIAFGTDIASVLWPYLIRAITYFERTIPMKTSAARFLFVIRD